MAWTPKTKQPETWTAREREMRPFDPAAFENDPVFDTGSAAGVWSAKEKQPEIWTES